MIYTAIIGDIKSSKKLENRKEVQEKFNAVLDYINETYKDSIAAKFIITLGDEFQGLLHDDTYLLDIIKYLQREMYPVKIRYGIGFGNITTEINKEAAIGADGPAFYAGRSMIESIRLSEKKIKSHAPDIMLGLYKNSHFELDKINTMLSLIKVIEDGWSDKQRFTIWDMLCNGGTQAECADRMSTTQSTVARRLADGNYTLYVDSLEVVNKSIQMIRGLEIYD
ncbi:MAG: SatD family protein [Lachnospiraceae bacterium]|nr:SatD family protein [Lachnospiraceae bacterium]